VVSALIDVDGVIFVEQVGTDIPNVTATYIDNEDGTGNKCLNDVTPAEQGRIQDGTPVLLTTCTMSVINGILDDNGDSDQFADTNETIDMQIRVFNNCGIPLQDCVASISTSDPKVACVLDSSINLGNFAEQETKTSTESFRWKVANVDRTTAGFNQFQAYNVPWKVSIKCGDDFEAVSIPQILELPLDLDVTAPGAGAGVFTEGFESNTLVPGTSFTNVNMDAVMNSNALANGFRCQYTDPDWVQSNVYHTTDAEECWPGQSDAHRAVVWWQIDGPNEDDGGRAFTGTRSLRYGAFIPGGGHTGPTSTFEGVRSVNPINLSATNYATLSFKLQASMVDNRVSNAPFDETWDGITVAAQVANASNVGVGEWFKLQPYEALYDQQKTDNMISCFFDPIDDGNTEDSFFDPTDPLRRLGPSTNCFPGFQYTWAGETVQAFSPNNVGHPSFLDGTGLDGIAGDGTWLQAKFSLARFLGQRVRIRFMHSTMKFDALLWTDAGLDATDPRDDGAWIDDMQVDFALGQATPATIVADTDAAGGLPNTCASGCSAANAVLTITPPSSTAPGQLLSLDGSGSSLNVCVNGTLQYRFLANSVVVRGWADSPYYFDAPFLDTTYELQIRCSANPFPTCHDSDVKAVTVGCPPDVGTQNTFPGSVTFGSGTIDSNTAAGDQTTNRSLVRIPAQPDPTMFIRGNTPHPNQETAWSYSFTTLGFAPAGATTFAAGADPTPGVCPPPPTGSQQCSRGFWYLAKTAPNNSPACNQSWNAGTTRGVCTAPAGSVGNSCTTDTGAPPAGCGTGGICDTRDEALP
jgi:hypothetical protein